MAGIGMFKKKLIHNWITGKCLDWAWFYSYSSHVL